tara:strand:+ start:34 stop:1764 length:1731 start_codon:yes stop_codon:yes gene_type:complete
MAVNTIGAGVILNEGQIDVDFRVEGNSATHTLFVEGETDRVGINTSSPQGLFHIQESAVTGFDAHADDEVIFESQSLLNLNFVNSVGTYILFSDADRNRGNIRYDHSSNFLSFATNDGSERMRIDSAGKVLIGHTASNNVRGIDPRVQIAGTDQASSGLTLTRYQAGAFGPGIHFAKSRNASLGGHTIVSDGDRIGDITWYASDGTDFANNCAAIMVNIDGSPGANNTPGRLTFHTAASGSGSASERMRISQDGAIRLGSTAKSSLSILGGTAASGAFRFSSGTDNENVHIEYYEEDINSIAFSEVIDTGGSQTWNKYNAAGALIQTVNQAGLVVLQQGANDGSILEFRSSDVAHGMTDQYPTDTYGAFNKSSNNDGGLRMEGYSEAKIGIQLDGISTTDNTDRSTTASGNISLRAWRKSNNSWDTIESDGNLLTVGNGNAVRFIIDEDGDVHADNSINATAFDTYNDAQLVRAFDLSHGKNLIQSKFDEFIDYNHEKLAELKLVGREADGTPNHFMNVTGMQRLHNGAIWQQYTEMQKMKELMYDAMVELMGKEKADKKLKNHDIQLLQNNDLLN